MLVRATWEFHGALSLWHDGAPPADLETAGITYSEEVQKSAVTRTEPRPTHTGHTYRTRDAFA